MMVKSLEKIVLGFYEICWISAIPFLSKNKRLAEGLDQRKLKQQLPQADIWIQAASAGEAYLAQSILSTISPPKPINVLLTSNTRQGIDILNDKNAEMRYHKNLSFFVSYFPFDRPSIMKQAIKQVSPHVMVLLESELWPGLLSALKNAGTDILLINGRMSERSFKHYHCCSSFWANLAPDRVYAISKEDADRFASLFGKTRVSVLSNIKFDRINPDNSHGGILESVKRIIPTGVPFLVMASIREEEELLILQMIQKILKHNPATVIGLFPRHMHRLAQWQKILQKNGLTWRFRSDTTNLSTPGTVLLWDIFGELTSSYQFATAAFVGGSLVPLGGQNFLEPLICGVVPVTGPHWDNFYWVGNEIIDSGLVFMADDWIGAADKLIKVLHSPPSRESVRRRALDYFRKHQGGSKRACEIILRHLSVKQRQNKPF